MLGFQTWSVYLCDWLAESLHFILLDEVSREILRSVRYRSAMVAVMGSPFTVYDVHT